MTGRVQCQSQSRLYISLFFSFCLFKKWFVRKMMMMLPHLRPTFYHKENSHKLTNFETTKLTFNWTNTPRWCMSSFSHYYISMHSVRSCSFSCWYSVLKWDFRHSDVSLSWVCCLYSLNILHIPVSAASGSPCSDCASITGSINTETHRSTGLPGEAI